MTVQKLAKLSQLALTFLQWPEFIPKLHLSLILQV